MSGGAKSDNRAGIRFVPPAPLPLAAPPAGALRPYAPTPVLGGQERGWGQGLAYCIGAMLLDLFR